MNASREANMFRALFLLLAFQLSWTASCRADFEGNFELGPAGCEQTGKCILTYDFRFTDPKGLVWQAAASNKTDGASIPAWAQPIIGSPFDKSYIKAAVIHDHYCDRHVRPWRA